MVWGKEKKIPKSLLKISLIKNLRILLCSSARTVWRGFEGPLHPGLAPPGLGASWPAGPGAVTPGDPGVGTLHLSGEDPHLPSEVGPERLVTQLEAVRARILAGPV